MKTIKATLLVSAIAILTGCVAVPVLQDGSAVCRRNAFGTEETASTRQHVIAASASATMMHQHPNRYSLTCCFAALGEALRALHSKSHAARPGHRVQDMMVTHLRPQHICRRRGSTQTRS